MGNLFKVKNLCWNFLMRSLVFVLSLCWSTWAFAVTPKAVAEKGAFASPEQAMMVCLEGAAKIEQGYLLADDGQTKIAVLKLTDAPTHCRTNRLSHPFVIDLVNRGEVKDSLWFNAQSVDAVLRGDGWMQRPKRLDVRKKDLFVYRENGEVSLVARIHDVVDSGDPNAVWIMFEFKTDNGAVKTGSILLEPDSQGVEIWTPKTPA